MCWVSDENKNRKPNSNRIIQHFYFFLQRFCFEFILSRILEFRHTNHIVGFGVIAFACFSLHWSFAFSFGVIKIGGYKFNLFSYINLFFFLFNYSDSIAGRTANIFDEFENIHVRSRIFSPSSVSFSQQNMYRSKSKVK